MVLNKYKVAYKIILFESIKGFKTQFLKKLFKPKKIIKELMFIFGNM